MILACPYCAASHSRSDAELATRPILPCRRCGKNFQAGLDGATALSGDAQTAPVPPAAAPAPAAPSGAGEFSDPTTVMKAPAALDISAPAPATKPASASLDFSAATTVMKAKDLKTQLAVSAADAVLDSILEAPVGKAGNIRLTPVKLPAGGAEAKPSSGNSAAIHEPMSASAAPAPVPAPSATPAKPVSSAPLKTAAATPAKPVSSAAAKAATPAAAPSSSLSSPTAAAPAAAAKPAAAPSRPPVSGEFEDVPTQTIETKDLKQTLERMRVGDHELDNELSVGDDLDFDAAAKAAPEPGEGARPQPSAPPPGTAPMSMRLLKERLDRELALGALKTLPRRARLVLAAAAVLPTLLVALIAMSAGGSEPEVGYLDRHSSLRAQPGRDDEVAELGQLVRGAQLTIFDESGEYALVRDLSGRAGYVAKDAVHTAAPTAGPDYAFADCVQAPAEASQKDCLARAQRQFDSCRETCNERTACLQRCQDRLTACTTSCEGRAPTPVAMPELEEPAPEEPPAAAAVAEEPVETADAGGKKGKNKLKAKKAKGKGAKGKGK